MSDPGSILAIFLAALSIAVALGATLKTASELVRRLTRFEVKSIDIERDRATAMLRDYELADEAPNGSGPSEVRSAHPQLRPSTEPPSYFDRLVTINVDNLAAYYGLVKVHANYGFAAAVIAGAVGFMFVLIGVIIALLNYQTTGIVAATAGIITEFISAVFFYLYNKTVRQLKEYHDSLLDVQNTLLAFRIIEQTQDDATRAQMAAELLGYLVQKSDVQTVRPSGARVAR